MQSGTGPSAGVTADGQAVTGGPVDKRRLRLVGPGLHTSAAGRIIVSARITTVTLE